jgi:hypothetical protein
VNWGGDEGVQLEEYIGYMAELIGVTPIFVYDDGPNFARGWADPTRRQSLTGPCGIPWRDGLRRIVRHWEPILREAGPPARQEQIPTASRD